MKRFVLFMALAAAPATAQHHDHQRASAIAVQAPAHPSAYAEGLYLLHNFEYERAADAFRRAQAADAANVMAYWGEAMTYNHPLWAYQDRDAALAALAKLGPTPELRRARARNDREAAWLDAVETLYGVGDKVERDRLYHDKMMALYRSDPTDIDALSFAALATLGLAHEGRDTATYMAAAAMLEEALPSHPEHPGVLHYLIHSYDDPDHVPLGLRAARRYAKVAPDAGHAQHMVSHIYLALGDWPSVEATNLQAMKVVNAERAAAGRPPTYCGHYNEWLVYALDQQAKDSQPIVDGCAAQALAELAAATDTTRLGKERSAFNNWATIAARHGVDTGRWPTVPDLPGDRHLMGQFDLAYARLLQSRGDAAQAAKWAMEMKRLHGAIVTALPVERPDDHESRPWLDVAVAQADAVVALAQRQPDALAQLAAVADREAALPVPFGPPILAKPTAEMLADEYAAAGRHAEAGAAYRRALKATPNRRRSLSGSALH